jgi:hypothetical protein
LCFCARQRKQFFFEKKNQKTFAIKASRLPQSAYSGAKVFASFFKKKRFLAADGSVSIAPGITSKTEQHDKKQIKA